MEKDVLDAASGAAIDRMCRRALEGLRLARPTVQTQLVEKSNEQIAAELQRKALPAVQRDAAVIRKATAENELKRRADEAQWANARMEHSYGPAE